MLVPARIQYTYDEVDSETLPASERVVLWRETGRLPMAAEPPDEESRRRFHISVHKLSGPSGRFADLVATPMKLSRTKDHCNRDGLDMISLTLMLGPDVQHQFGTAGRSAVVQPGQILVKDFAQPATAWWQTSSRSLNLHLPRLLSRGCGRRESQALARDRAISRGRVANAGNAVDHPGKDCSTSKECSARGGAGYDCRAGGQRASLRVGYAAGG